MTEAFKRLNAKITHLEKEFSISQKWMRWCAFPNDAKRSIRIIKIQISPIKRSGKDTSNPLMVSTLPKSEGEGSSSKAQLPGSFIHFSTGQDKHNKAPNTSPRNTNNNITRSNSREEDYENIHIIKMLKSQCMMIKNEF
ncbi:hypothetical protein H5410_014195 [Solanum commersonii]|uniref:Uncharacterized protein n=1 Tax=Solanum commersonii TaxID=4109 RepID=A0A9J5ZQJ3_SOLCO|nr:hypothetical protein H5410_014195 [Solanum commersonii]